jgi:hypothetical protein
MPSGKTEVPSVAMAEIVVPARLNDYAWGELGGVVVWRNCASLACKVGPELKLKREREKICGYDEFTARQEKANAALRASKRQA